MSVIIPHIKNDVKSLFKAKFLPVFFSQLVYFLIWFLSVKLLMNAPVVVAMINIIAYCFLLLFVFNKSFKDRKDLWITCAAMCSGGLIWIILAAILKL